MRNSLVRIGCLALAILLPSAVRAENDGGGQAAFARPFASQMYKQEGGGPCDSSCEEP